MMNNYNFYDTSSLLLRAGTLFEQEEQIVISSITLKELEEIKTSNHKTGDIKFAARRILSLLTEHIGAYETVIFTEKMLEPIVRRDLTVTNDTKILACAIWYDKYVHPDETNFITNDLSLFHIANLFFGTDSISSVKRDIDDVYVGYKEVIMDEETMG